MTGVADKTRKPHRRVAEPAADVEYLVTAADPVGRLKVLVVCAQLDVVEIGRRRHRRDGSEPGGAV